MKTKKKEKGKHLIFRCVCERLCKGKIGEIKVCKDCGQHYNVRKGFVFFRKSKISTQQISGRVI